MPTTPSPSCWQADTATDLHNHVEPGGDSPRTVHEARIQPPSWAAASSTLANRAIHPFSLVTSPLQSKRSSNCLLCCGNLFATLSRRRPFTSAALRMHSRRHDLGSASVSTSCVFGSPSFTRPRGFPATCLIACSSRRSQASVIRIGIIGTHVLEKPDRRIASSISARRAPMPALSASLCTTKTSGSAPPMSLIAASTRELTSLLTFPRRSKSGALSLRAIPRAAKRDSTIPAKGASELPSAIKTPENTPTLNRQI